MRILTVPATIVTLAAALAASAASIPSGETYTNSLGMKFVRIEPGSSRMGSDGDLLPAELTTHRGTRFDGDFDEHPARTVTITRPFYLAATEVTNYHYEIFDPSHRALRARNDLSEKDEEAVIFVSWYDAAAFCRWLSDKENLTYRLPTEAEWEYACRAGTTTPFHTGDSLPESFRKHQVMEGRPFKVPLEVGKNCPNAWGLFDMHGNVEEWCFDWYGPYNRTSLKDPVGYAEGDFKVARGGSHSTITYYLRSANRMGTVPESRSWLTGFRPVIGRMPDTEPLARPRPPLNQRDVNRQMTAAAKKGPDPDTPYFLGPRKYVRIPKEADGPVFAGHNHCPAIVECPNGDLLAIWYTGVGERERNMAVCASRLVCGRNEWRQASPFWDPPDRNDTALSMWFNGTDTIYHFNSMSVSSNWSRMSVIMRTSKDSGATWSKARLILPEYNGNHQLSEPVFRTNGGAIVIAVDGPNTLFFSRDGGLTWFNPGGDIPGIHTGVTQLNNGDIAAISRSGYIEGRMPMSVSTDAGKTFSYRPTEFPGIGGGQRAVLLMLREGALFMASFGNLYGNTQTAPVMITDADGDCIQAKELFAAVSFDGGRTWPHKRIVGPNVSVTAECTDGGAVTVGPRSSEHRGYLSVCQGLDGIIHLISSRQHYAFNLEWLTTAPPPAGPQLRIRHEVESFSGPDFDLAGWFDYKGYTGNFNGQGQYAIDSIMPYGGINRVVGAGSFDATFEICKIRYHNDLRWRDISVGFKDKLSRTWFFVMGQNRMSMRLKDTEAPGSGDFGTDRSELLEVFAKPPDSVKLRFWYDQNSGRCRFFYGVNGAEPETEPRSSKEGLHLSKPFSESNAAYILVSEARVAANHFEIKPL